MQTIQIPDGMQHADGTRGTVSAFAPTAPVSAVQTYSIRQPRDVFVRAACEEVGCLDYERGWSSAVDESTPLGQFQGSYIRYESGRTFKEQRDLGGITIFTFDSKQRCFAEHKTRPQIFRKRDGDWRGNPTGRALTHQTAADWVEDFGLNQIAVRDLQERG